jgi:hypothetical protein
MNEFSRLLDVDLEVLTAAPWVPWTPTTCPTCGGRSTEPLDPQYESRFDPPCPDCSAGLVVPQVGDVINWQRPVRNVIPGHPLYQVDPEWETVARSTVHQTAPIVGPERFNPPEDYPRIEVVSPSYIRLHYFGAPWPGAPESKHMWLHRKLYESDALLDGPWAELWVPGHVALEITTEVER